MNINKLLQKIEDNFDSKEKQFWDLIQFNKDKINNISGKFEVHIHEIPEEKMEEMIIYHSYGYCFVLTKEFVCYTYQLGHKLFYGEVDNDGYEYCFTEPYDSFKKCGINKAIKIIMEENTNMEIPENILKNS